MIKSLRSNSRSSIRRIEELSGEGGKAYKKLRRYVRASDKGADRAEDKSFHERHRSMSK